MEERYNDVMMDREVYETWLDMDFEELINEHKATADNERLWANGSTGEAHELHLHNAEQHTKFAAFLESVREIIKEKLEVID